MSYIDGKARVGKADIFTCPHCQDGKLIKAWEKLCAGKDGLLAAYRLGKSPTEKTWKMIEQAKKVLGFIK